MTCNDCLHYDVCKRIVPINNRDLCRIVKDKSLFVELPCKIGDTVYVIVNPNQIHCASVATIPFCVALYSEFGRTVFLTKEEAEAKIKEWYDDL